MEKRDYAVILKHSGCNCAQAVLCAFAAETGLSEDLLKRMGAGFGAGMGCMEATCGALVGAEILLGLKLYQDRPVLANQALSGQTGSGKCPPAARGFYTTLRRVALQGPERQGYRRRAL